jgi:hypothetical protein
VDFFDHVRHAVRQLPLRCYLATIAILVNEVKGKSALALSRDLTVSYKCAFVLLHKLREAMADELKDRTFGGEGKTVIKPANFKENRRVRRLVKNHYRPRTGEAIRR